MSVVESEISDPSVKGVWCVPTHANPTGETFSADSVRQMADMKTAAPDFRLFWDEAYLLHPFHDDQVPAENILLAAERAGHADRPLVFTSITMITFSGAGVGFVAAFQANIDWYAACRLARGPGEDKVNRQRIVDP